MTEHTNSALRSAAPGEPVPKEVTQARLDLRSRAAARIHPSEHYTLADRLEQQASVQGERPFLYYRDICLTYAQVNAHADRVAHGASALGLKAGDVCAMALENRPAFFTTWFGLAKLGVTVAFINTQISGKPLLHAVQTTAAKAVIVGQECAQLFADTLANWPELARVPLYWLADDECEQAEPLPGLSNEFSLLLSSEAGAAPFGSAARAALSAESPSLLIFTSGTTGLPKAAIYSHMRWLMSGDVMQVTTEATADDVFYCCLPLYHGAAATSVTSTALAAGAAIVVRRKFSVREFWRDVRHYRISVVQYIGEICRYLLNHDDSANAGRGQRDHSVRCMLGAGLSAESWRRWLDKFGPMDIYEGWGSTESNTNLINLDNRIGACGRVPDWSKTNFRLVKFDMETESHEKDAAGRYLQCQPGDVGEGLGMIIHHPDFGGGRFEGYTCRDATEQKILRNVFEPGDAYWRSGDLLRFDEQGYCYFVDRVGDTFRWKSENVSTQEVAAALDDFDGAETINIYGVQVPEQEGRAGMAAVVMQAGRQFDPQAFYSLTSQRLPSYACPQFVRVSASADMTSTFKLRKVDLQKQGYDPQLVGDPLYVRNDKAGTYQPWSEAVLTETGFARFGSGNGSEIGSGTSSGNNSGNKE
ncbi:long-chain-acyl-CoA synthetase [Shewanella sp. GXUN23E]|uniref:long-chain-acyl-CoA synthetase n=1 Tax=Shewanella sp. GXUN23E TaxID=3422498 RepID=UPI003D7D1194